MPNHETHERIGVITAPIVFAGSMLVMSDITTAIVTTAAYISATYFFSPDLDTDSAAYYRWNFLSLFWYPYKKLIPHRSWLSHSGPISGTIRFGYFLGGLFVIQTLLQAFIDPSIQLLTFHTYYGILWVAIILADTLHTLLDILVKGEKHG